MARQGKTDHFLGQLLEQLKAFLPSTWEAQGARHWRLVQQREWGYVGVGPAMTFKGLPSTGVYLEFGVMHHALEPALKRLNEAAGYPHLDTYQVSQTTDNYPLVPGCHRADVDDYNQPPSRKVLDRLIGGPGVQRLLALFDRFSRLSEVRDSLERRDGALLSLGAPKLIVVIDLALNDLDHLRTYRDACPAKPDRRMVDNALAVLGITL